MYRNLYIVCDNNREDQLTLPILYAVVVHFVNKAHNAQIQVHLPKNIDSISVCTGCGHSQHDSFGHIGKCCVDCTLATAGKMVHPPIVF